MNKLGIFLENREEAQRRGDRGVMVAMDAELARMGYAAPETTQAMPLPERAVPDKPRRGRPPRPRCEHDMIIERCPECREEGL